MKPVLDSRHFYFSRGCIAGSTGELIFFSFKVVPCYTYHGVGRKENFNDR